MKIKREVHNILLVITVFSIGGATETVVSIAAGLKRRGYPVKIISGPPLKNEGDMFRQAADAGIEVDVMPDMVRNINPLRDIVCFLKLVSIIRREGFDIVHTHSSKAGFIGRLAAWVAGVPHIVHTIHGLPYHEYQHPFWKGLFIFLEKFAAAFSTKIICVSDAIITNCVYNRIAPRGKFVMIRSGFETKHFIAELSHREEVRRQYGFTDGDIIAGTVSRIAPLKGHDHIIQLAARLSKELPQLKFFFVGDGESKAQLEEMTRKNGLERVVIFSGLVQPDRIPQMISAMDIIIHLSYREGLARVLPQSIVMGRKVITYGIEGVEEVIKSDEGGYVVAPGDMEALSSVCRSLVETPDRRLIPDTFRRRIIQEFDSDTMVEMHLKIYNHF